MDDKMIQMAKTLFKDRRTPVAEICATLGVSEATFYRHVSSAKTRTACPSSR
jgi:AcrR family transcriptional regulator